jgi:hypothetical protein
MVELLHHTTDWLWTNLCFELQTPKSQSSLPRANKKLSTMDCNSVNKRSTITVFTEGTSMSKEKNKELALSLEMMELLHGVNSIEGKLMESQRLRNLMAIFIVVNSRKVYQLDTGELNYQIKTQ